MLRQYQPFVVAMGALALVACNSSSSDDEQPAPEPPPVGDNVLQLAEDNNTFALHLYQQLQAQGDQQGNLAFSPYSVSATMAMLHAGAREDTAVEMAEVLNFQLEPENLHAGFRDLREVLNHRGAELEEGDDLSLLSANSMWFDENQPLLEDFVAMLDIYHGSSFHQVSFEQAPEDAREAMNTWVAEQTADQLTDLLPEGSIVPETRLVLLNALHFTGDWLYPFDQEESFTGDFKTLAGETVSTAMMYQEVPAQYTQGEFYEAVSLDYVGHDLSMVLVVPEPGQFQTVQENLDAGMLQNIHDNLSDGLVELTLPAFELEQRIGLRDALQGLGLAQVFDPNSADLSGISDDYSLFLDAVLQKAVVTVDEEGTEAAAATGAVVREVSQPELLGTLTIDRPFMFFIQDQETQTILFAGQLVEPEPAPES